MGGGGGEGDERPGEGEDRGMKAGCDAKDL